MDEDKVINSILEIQEDIAKINSKLDIVVTREDLEKNTALLEHIVTITKKTQEDGLATVDLYRRLQAQVDKQGEEIDNIKIKLAIA